MAHAPHAPHIRVRWLEREAPRLTFGRIRAKAALFAALTLAALGVVSFGLFSLVASLTDGTANLSRASQASAARLNAQAAVYAAGGSAQPLPNGASQPAALEAYGRRWAALVPSNAPAPARQPTSISQEALDAYAARWSALEHASGLRRAP